MITMHRGMTAAQLQVLRSTGTVYSHREAVAMMAARAAYNRHMHGRPVDPEWIDKLERPPVPTPPPTRSERAAARLGLLDLTHSEPETSAVERASAGETWRRAMPKLRAAILALAVVMTATLAACGGGSDAPATPAEATPAAAVVFTDDSALVDATATTMGRPLRIVPTATANTAAVNTEHVKRMDTQSEPVVVMHHTTVESPEWAEVHNRFMCLFASRARLGCVITTEADTPDVRAAKQRAADATSAMLCDLRTGTSRAEALARCIAASE